MVITADTLSQAREAVVSLNQQKISLLSLIHAHAQKISDLEREVQKQATIALQAQEALANAKVEIEALRSQLPDEATRQAFKELGECLSSPAQDYSELRTAA